MSVPLTSVVDREYKVEPFVCKRCGKCCTGEGYVNVSDEECLRIAEFLGISLADFLEQYTRKEPGFERWLADGPGEEMPCIFLERTPEGLSGCRIQGDAKPRQCSTFPVQWRRNDAHKWCQGLLDAQNEMAP